MPSDPEHPPTPPLNDQEAIRQRVQWLEQEHPDRYADLEQRFQQDRARDESVELERFKRTIDLVEYAKKAGYEVRAGETMGGVTVLAHPNEDRIAVAQNSRGQWAYASLNRHAPPLPSEPQAHVWSRLRDAIARTEDKGTIVEFAKTREGERSLNDVRQRLRQASVQLHPRGAIERADRDVAGKPDGDRLRQTQERPAPSPSGPTRPAHGMPTPARGDATPPPQREPRDPLNQRGVLARTDRGLAWTPDGDRLRQTQGPPAPSGPAGRAPGGPGGESGAQDRLRQWREGVEASVETHLRRAPSDPQRALNPGNRASPTPTPPSAPARRGPGQDRGR